MIQILFPKLSYRITGLCFKVQNKLGRFCREKQYADFLELLPKVYKALDKAAKVGVIKKNTASRKKSRVSKLIQRSE